MKLSLSTRVAEVPKQEERALLGLDDLTPWPRCHRGALTAKRAGASLRAPD